LDLKEAAILYQKSESIDIKDDVSIMTDSTAATTVMKEPVEKKWTNLNNLVKKLGGLVVQKYLEKPSLINNRKYDLRYFMLIGCTKPWIVMTNPGYARISIEEFTTESYGNNNKADKLVHLTNASV